MSDVRLGKFKELMALTEPAMQPIARRLRDVIIKVDPSNVEVVRLGDRAATFGLGPKKMSEGYVYIMPHSSWVNLGFYKGALLSDPAGLMEGTGAKMRHVKIRSIEDAEQNAVRTLIKAALEERKNSLGR